jgi:hypothetical protein
VNVTVTASAGKPAIGPASIDSWSPVRTPLTKSGGTCIGDALFSKTNAPSPLRTPDSSIGLIEIDTEANWLSPALSRSNTSSTDAVPAIDSR